MSLSVQNSRCFLLAGFLLACLVVTNFAWAQPRLISPEEALERDAAGYAAAQGVTQEEAVRRFELQEKVGYLQAALLEEEKDSFAGLWIEHTPEFRVVVRFTEAPAGDRLKKALKGTELASLVVLEGAKYSLAELSAKQSAALYLARQLGFVVEVDINIKTNLVELYLTESQALESRLASAGVELPAGVVVFQVARLSVSEVDIYGGLAISTCTTGFSVKNAANTRGVSTAAHCNDAQSYAGNALTFQSADRTGNQDVQWHTAPGLTVTNQFNVGGSVRSCTATKSRTNQAVGNYVCKYGKTSGYTCGSISSTSYLSTTVTDGQATFIRVNNDQGYADLSSGGDSGGPWFNSNTAYGTHVGTPTGDDNDAFYMAINYITSLGVTVLTAP